MNWKCDGKDCKVTGTLAEVDKHIIDNMYNENGEMKSVDEIKCWGAVGVE